MVFSVISVASGLSAAEFETALAHGPPYIESENPYAELLEQTGWHVVDCIDITEDFVNSVRCMVDAQKANAEQLREFLGDTETAARMARMKGRLAAREAGLHLRELYVVTPRM
tara:strand:- start:96 stop:434 length:339 start_codon:yes stop_codon:yes gene_type:complete